jgi:prepilin-type N-terminal cleavage/methylation domain-containing protein/prepilin-type processing-associated H-X9-DG protein
MKRKRAFTLIELLVVIAIIAILAAILFPVFAQAKEAAKKTQDLSNQKQIALGQVMYMGDADDMFPRGEQCTLDREPWARLTWRELSGPYIKNGIQNVNWVMRDKSKTGPVAIGGLFRSPAEPSNSRMGYTAHKSLFAAIDWNDAYAEVDGNCNPRTGAAYAPVPSSSSSNLDKPADTAVTWPQGLTSQWGDPQGVNLGESHWWWHGGAIWPPEFTGPKSGAKWDNDRNCNWDGENGNPNCAMPRYRYTGGMNAGYADGHAKYVKKGAFNWCKSLYVGHNDRPAQSGERDDTWVMGAGQICEKYMR